MTQVTTFRYPSANLYHPTTLRTVVGDLMQPPPQTRSSDSELVIVTFNDSERSIRVAELGDTRTCSVVVGTDSAYVNILGKTTIEFTPIQIGGQTVSFATAGGTMLLRLKPRKWAWCGWICPIYDETEVRFRDGKYKDCSRESAKTLPVIVTVIPYTHMQVIWAEANAPATTNPFSVDIHETTTTITTSTPDTVECRRLWKRGDYNASTPDWFKKEARRTESVIVCEHFQGLITKRIPHELR